LGAVQLTIGHYKCALWFSCGSSDHHSYLLWEYTGALKIDQILDDIGKRSSYMKFDVAGIIVTNSEYKGTCDKK
jgi:hypothetical protein